uniref:Peptidase S1 domain-containing protein n=1 Tax=Romanomermis culicivorax TaxID=13658 RepID=A0A915KB96_ROMCU
MDRSRCPLKLVTLLLCLLPSISSDRPNDMLGLKEKCGKSDATDYRIFGGTSANKGEFPWAGLFRVKLKNDKDSRCSGVLITDSVFLTAAHCVCRRSSSCYDASKLEVAFGYKNFNRASNKFSILDYKTYKIISDSDVGSAGDFALLKVNISDRYVKKLGLRPICLPDKDYSVEYSKDQAFTAIGWGSMQAYFDFPTKLQKARFTYVNNTECSRLWRSNISNQIICTASDKGQDICQGDSGGPLMIQIESVWFLTGVAMSNGGTCGAEDESPAMFGSVFFFKDWFKSIVAQFNGAG